MKQKKGAKKRARHTAVPGLDLWAGSYAAEGMMGW